MTSAAMTASVQPAEFRAAGTDLSERRRSGVSTGPLIDIAAAPDTIGVAWGADGAARIGAFTIDRRDRGRRPHRAGLSGHCSCSAWVSPRRRSVISRRSAATSRSARAAGIFAIRISPASRRAASDCPARSGNHLYHVAFDLGPCVAPHPSTMAAALLAYDANITTNQRSALSIGGPAGRRLQRRCRPCAGAGRNDPKCRAAAAAVGRARALQARHQPQPCGVAAGRSLRPRRGRQTVRSSSSASPPAASRRFRSVSRRPRRSCKARRPTPQPLPEAAEQATSGAKPLPMTGYKLDLLRGRRARPAGTADDLEGSVSQPDDHREERAFARLATLVVTRF